MEAEASNLTGAGSVEELSGPDSSTAVVETAGVEEEPETEKEAEVAKIVQENNEIEPEVEKEKEKGNDMEVDVEVVSKAETVETEVVNEVSKDFELESKSEQEIVLTTGESETPSVANVNVNVSGVIPSSGEDSEVVKTLFVSGLPMDATSRELYLLCRSYKGYVDCKLNNARNKFGKPLAPIGFVTFASREEAEAAMAGLQDVVFDPLLPNTIRLEFAKCNSKVQKPPVLQQVKKNLPPASETSSANFISNANGNSTSAAAAAHFQRAASTGLAHDVYGNPYYPHNHPHPHPHPHHPPNSAPFMMTSSRSALPYSTLDHLPSSFYHPDLHPQPQTGLPFGDTLLRAYANPQSPVAFLNPLSNLGPSHAHNQAILQQQQQQHQQQPSSTLFVANLGLFVTEKELTDVFANTPGFLNVTLYKKGISPVAFVKYIDVRCAALAMAALQGSLLRYSDRGGIRIEFARSKIGDRDDNISMCGSAGFSDGDNNLIPNGWPSVPLSSLAPWMDPVSNWSVFSS